jgi:hypothetical protein
VAGGVEIERTDTTTTETFTELFPKATGGASSISLYSTTAANYANYQGFGLYMDPNGANISTFAQGTGVVLPMVFGASRFIFNSSIAVAPATGGSTILLDKPASGQEAAIYGRVGAGITRWGMSLGNTAAESAPANGSDFMLSRFDNTGAFLANPVHVNRATGAATLTCTSTGTAASDRNLSLNQASSGWAQLAFTAASAVKTLRMGSAGNLEIVNTANSLVLLDLKDSGAFVLPANPAFIASGASTAVGDLTWVTANVNIGGNFNPGNGRFTAPVTGTYLFSYHQLMPNAPAGEFRIGLYLNGFGYYGSRVIFNKAAGQWQSIQITAHVRMSANDYLVVRYESGPADLYTDGAYIQFDGNLVG